MHTIITLLFDVYSYVDFDIFVSQNEQFCNGTEIAAGGILKHGIYFQYRIGNNRPWITVDIYNGQLLAN